jgi:hypothetical protein
MANELTIASTTQLLDVHSTDWSRATLDHFHPRAVKPSAASSAPRSSKRPTLRNRTRNFLAPARLPRSRSRGPVARAP